VPTREVRLRSLAAADVADAVDYYRDEAGAALALGFIDAVEHAFDQIRRSPRTGSLQYSYDLGIPELRARKLARFPFVIFYVPSDEHIDVWRVLHRRRDVLAAFRDDE
jgi:toxin ParE1/3/4